MKTDSITNIHSLCDMSNPIFQFLKFIQTTYFTVTTTHEQNKHLKPRSEQTFATNDTPPETNIEYFPIEMARPNLIFLPPKEHIKPRTFKREVVPAKFKVIEGSRWPILRDFFYKFRPTTLIKTKIRDSRFAKSRGRKIALVNKTGARTCTLNRKRRTMG